jgi:hypothetical protein
MKKNITLSVNAKVENHNMLLHMALYNNENDKYFVRANILDAYRCGADLKIISGPSEVKCSKICTRMAPGIIKYTEFVAKGIIEEIIPLSNMCNFNNANAGTYTVSFETDVTLLTAINPNVYGEYLRPWAIESFVWGE